MGKKKKKVIFCENVIVLNINCRQILHLQGRNHIEQHSMNRYSLSHVWYIICTNKMYFCVFSAYVKLYTTIFGDF